MRGTVACVKPARPLPPAASLPFRSRDGSSIGVSKDRLRRGDIDHPFHGVSAAGVPGTTIRDRAQAFAPLLLPGQVFSHTTALALRGVPVFDDGVIHVSVAFPRTPPRGKGLKGHSLHRIDDVEEGGLPMSSVAAAWIESAAIASREELVALGDAVLPARTRRGLATLEELRAAADRVGVPGLRRAQWALPRMRHGVRSRPETHLRLAIIEAGLPEPVVEHPVVVAGGRTLHPDLFFVGYGLGLEYEGDGHRTDRRQWQHDLERKELFEDAGVRIMRVTSHDLWIARDALLARIDGALRRRER